MGNDNARKRVVERLRQEIRLLERFGEQDEKSRMLVVKLENDIETLMEDRDEEGR